MSTGKSRITITVDPHLAAYAEELVAAGKASSVSAAFNDAFTERLHRDRRSRQWWAEKAAELAADTEAAARVDRVRAHIDSRLRHLEQEQRNR